VAFAFEPANAVSADDLRELRAAAQSIHVDVQPVEVTSVQELESSLEAALAGHPQALLTNGGAIIPTHLAIVATFAARHGLPSASNQQGLTGVGGLMTYDARATLLHYRSGNYYADRILRGAKPADLPVEQPTVFDLAVNRTTARALGISIPTEFAAQVTAWVD
jgi:putative ABC transport system substrate-binding protein